jgi:signal transduction histidine kinase/CheY-like chemotaxis protein
MRRAISGLLSRRQLRAILLAAAVLFTTAAAISIYRLNEERSALFHTYRTGTWIIAEIQMEYLKTARAGTAFQLDPSVAPLGKLKTAFDVFWSRIELVKGSEEAAGVRDMEVVRDISSFLQHELPLLDADLHQAKSGDARSLDAFMTRMDGLNEPIAHMMQHVFIQNPLLYDRTTLVGSLDTTNVMLGIAVGTGLFLIVLSLVQLRRAERLSEQNSETRALLETRMRAIEAAREGIAIISPDGMVEFVNQSFVRKIGILSANLVLGRHWSEVPAVGRTSLQGAEPGKPISQEVAIVRGNNQTRYFDLSITRRDDGGAVVVVRDVTDRKAAQRMNETLREQFLRSQKMEAVGRLAGGIAHDFNNILAAVSGFAHLLKDDLAAQPEQAGFAQQIMAAAERGKDLVKRLLSFSRADIEQQNTVDPRQIAVETGELLSSTLTSRARLQTSIAPVLPKVFGNATQLTQIIMNLVLNACDATEESGGSVTLQVDTIDVDGGCADGLLAAFPGAGTDNPIRVSQVDEQTSRAWIGILSGAGAYVRIRVADTGTGIPFNIMENMFDPFFTTKPQGKGTGLGLASVMGIVKSHQGAIAVQSTVGQGTEFNIMLPVAKEAAEPATGLSDRSSALVLSGIRVLIVDDDVAVGTVLQKMFDRLDCDATFAPDPLMVRDALIEEPAAFDLIITDMMMPELNGTELAAACRRAGYKGALLLVTGRTELVSEPLLRGAGIDVMVSKPFTQEEITGAIRKALEARALLPA